MYPKYEPHTLVKVFSEELNRYVLTSVCSVRMKFEPCVYSELYTVAYPPFFPKKVPTQEDLCNLNFGCSEDANYTHIYDIPVEKILDADTRTEVFPKYN